MSVELILEKKLSYLSRTFIAIFIAILVFYLGLYKFKKNQLLMPFWQRDYSNITHGFFSFGHTGKESIVLPSAIVMLITAGLIITMIYKAVVLYPKDLNIHFIILLLIDSLAISTFVNIFIFTGTISEVFYYIGAFAGGAYLFSSSSISRNVIFVTIIVLMIRIVFVGDFYLYSNFIPPLLLVYFFLRVPIDSLNFTQQFQSLSKNIKKEA